MLPTVCLCDLLIKEIVDIWEKYWNVRGIFYPDGKKKCKEKSCWKNCDSTLNIFVFKILL